MGNVIASLNQKDYQTLLTHLFDLPNSIFIKNANLQNYKKIVGKQNLDKYKVVGYDDEIYIIPLDKKQQEYIHDTNIGQEILRIIFYHLFLIQKPNQTIFSYINMTKTKESGVNGYFIPDEMLDRLKSETSIFVAEQSLADAQTGIIKDSTQLFNISRTLVPSIINKELERGKSAHNNQTLTQNILFSWSEALVKYTPSPLIQSMKPNEKKQLIHSFEKYKNNPSLKDIFPFIESVLSYIIRNSDNTIKNSLKNILLPISTEEDIDIESDNLHTQFAELKLKVVSDYTQKSGDTLLSSLMLNVPRTIDIINLTAKKEVNEALKKFEVSRFVTYSQVQESTKEILKRDLERNYTLCKKLNKKIPVLSDKHGICYTTSLQTSGESQYAKTHLDTSKALVDCLKIFFDWFAKDMGLFIDLMKKYKQA